MDKNSASNFDLISIGDATVDVFLSLNQINDRCRLDKENNEFCVKYGEKILVDESLFLLGGNGCNVAVGASRLNVNTAFFSELGDDEFAEVVFKGLKVENVDTSFVKKTENLQTNFAIIITFEKDKILFARHIPRNHDFSLENISTKYVYLTSMGKEWKKAYQTALDYVKKSGAKLAFNPGTTQIKEGMESFIDVIKQTDVSFFNKGEAARLTGANSKFKVQSSKLEEEDRNFIKTLLNEVKKLGSKVVIITDNNNGSYAIDEDGKMYHIPIFPGDAIQKTGAGDAYTSGFLSAIINNLSVQEAMKWGAVNATGVIQKVGAQTGLLTKEEMEVKLKENPEFKAKEI